MIARPTRKSDVPGSLGLNAEWPMRPRRRRRWLTFLVFAGVAAMIAAAVFLGAH